jgi:TonB family protein
MNPAHRAVLVSAACTLFHFSPAHAQHALYLGNFVVPMVRDAATGQFQATAAVVDAEAEGPEGRMMWRCVAGGVEASVQLGTDAGHGDTRSVVWRFDRDRPDSMLLQKGIGAMWNVPDDRVARLAVRATTARRLVIRPVDGGAAAEPEYVFSLDGVRRAFDRLECALHPAAPARGAGEVPPDERTYEMSAVDVQPQLMNAREFTRRIARSVPPELREARLGGSVTLQFRVLENGLVDGPSVRVTGSTHEAMNEPAIQAVRRLILSPAFLNGRAVKVWVEQPFTFEAG